VSAAAMVLTTASELGHIGFPGFMRLGTTTFKIGIDIFAPDMSGSGINEVWY
jgi:hypothetical protein